MEVDKLTVKCTWDAKDKNKQIKKVYEDAKDQEKLRILKKMYKALITKIKE